MTSSPREITERAKTTQRTKTEGQVEFEGDMIGDEEIEEGELRNDRLLFENDLDVTKGARLSFTFTEGLIAQVQPNGDLLQI